MYKYTISLKKVCVWLFSLLLYGCVDAIDMKQPLDRKYLVVQGAITNEPGPYSIKLSMTATYGIPTKSVPDEVKGATVTISDENGQKEILEDAGLGYYVTKKEGLRGRVGGVYTLTIQLKDGRIYSSKQEVLSAGADFENLQLDFRERTVYATGNEGQLLPVASHVYDLIVNVNDPSQVKNYYKWEWRGIYQVSTQPWNYTTVDTRTGKSIPAPKDCCQTCWIYDSVHVVEVSNDRFFDGSMFQKKVGSIPLTAEAINVRYKVEVIQSSLSAEAYDYWHVLLEQTQNTGSILDSPPANAKSNLICITNPEEVVFGYFEASSVTRKTLYINREDVPVVPPMLDFPNDCRVLSNSNTLLPSNW